MASNVSIPMNYRAQFQSPTWPPKPPKITRIHKSYKNLHFLSVPANHCLSTPLLSSSSFPLITKFPRNLLPFHPLQDATEEHIIEDIDNSMRNHQNLENLIKLDLPTGHNRQIIRQELSERVLIPDPPWISALFFKGLYKIANRELKVEFKDIEKRKYNLLRRRQIRQETEAWERMAEEYRCLVKEMCERKLAPNLPYVKGLFLGWFEPLKEAIKKEQNLQRSKKQKAAFAPHIELLPADKMAVIVMHKLMGLVMVGHEDGCVPVVQAAVQIGMAVEQEALDMLGNTKWRVNRRVLDAVESIWARGGNIAGLVDREDIPIPEKPLSEDLREIQQWRWSMRKAKKINRERHSQRCDTELKLSVAQKLKDEEGFYYPHNLDFRGRAYPMHPHLTHLSSDICRGILEFAEGPIREVWVTLAEDTFGKPVFRRG
ncbi:hypothetical protein GH714_010235 [Hevea brasiliensis]|uniref:DNA-directed RNA polymerase N-terminal domain-containing protein n=1 Tax=Hevea brasiliensis TaxID=3981 RepID=A0A6A6MDI3_HEVBR|nr:hypothetical protein GH714_010235 [Hevea brasiliensis]